MCVSPPFGAEHEEDAFARVDGVAAHLWFDLAQFTNDWDPPYSHGVFVNLVGAKVAAARSQA